MTWNRQLPALAAFLILTTAAAAQEEPQGWPRAYRLDGAEVVLYQPQIDSWELYSRLEARLAVSITEPGAEKPTFGALRLTAETRTDLETRQVLLTDVRLVETRFPSLAQADAERWHGRLATLLPNAPQRLSLDRFLANVERGRAADAARELDVSFEPPAVYYSPTPAVLVLVDGDPVLVPIEGTDLHFVANTNWDLFFRTSTSTYFLLHEDFWLKAPAEESWRPAGTLPEGFANLPLRSQWAEVRNHYPGRTPAAGEVPRVYLSTRPAELLLLDGAPRPESIPETGLAWVTNTGSDLFITGDGVYYLLLSGRWFRAAQLAGPWAHAAELPAGFAAIPEEHEAGHVLASVPGTPQAEEAVLLAQVPTKATVDRAASVQVTYHGPPRFQPIAGTAMAYAVNTASDVIRLGTLFYLCHEGIWFAATSATGPWVVIDQVPQEIYTIPASSPLHHTTYVHVYEATPETVVTGYTGGYLGLYVAAGAVIFGTGHYYPPFVYAARYPVYYPYPFTYGARATYNPYTGTYTRGAHAYGPYGGAGRAAAYNPHTGAYARGAYAYGPYGGAGRAAAYNPRTGAHAYGGYAYGPGGAAAAGRAYNPATGAYATGYRAANPYARWGESVRGRGDQWVHSGHYSSRRGSAVAYETSGGRSGAVARGAGGDLYAGHDGNIYRRNAGGGWSKYDSGSWSSVDTSRARGAVPAGRGAAGRTSFGTPTSHQDVMRNLESDARRRASGERRAKASSSRSRGSAADGRSRSGGGRRRGGP